MGQTENNRSQESAQAKSKVWPIGIRIIAICVAIIAILSVVGLNSDSYDFVKPLSNYALMLMIPIALTAGVVAAHLTVRQPADNQPTSKITTGLLIVATLILLFSAVVPGIALLIIFGLRKARTRIPSGGRSLGRSLINAVLIILGFIVGVIPGLIFALLISYPLTIHACKLSGSKYC